MFVLLLSKIFSRKTVKRVSQMFLRKKREKKNYFEIEKERPVGTVSSPNKSPSKDKTKRQHKHQQRKKKKLIRPIPQMTKQNRQGIFKKTQTKWGSEIIEIKKRWRGGKQHARNGGIGIFKQVNSPSLPQTENTKRKKQNTFLRMYKKEKKKRQKTRHVFFFKFSFDVLLS